MQDEIHVASWFSYFKSCFIPRYCNAVAYHLVSLARYSDSEIWNRECSNCIENFVNLNLLVD